MKLESPKRYNIATSFLSSYLLTLWMLLVAQTAYAQDPPPNLFSATNFATEAPQISNPTVRRSRLASINFSLLGAEPNLQQGLFQPVINLNLFADTTLPAIHDRTEKTPRGFAWIGHIQDKPLSQVTIVVNGDVVSGNISSPEGRYHIRFAGKGIHAIQEIDSSKFPEEDPPFQPLPTFAPKAHKAASKEAVSAKEDDGSEIDVMVAYTDDARNTVGGTAAMESLIDLGIIETNTAYTNSDANQRLNLVHTVEVAYNETGNMETDLDCITDTDDGCLDNIHALRDQHKADLVSLWTDNGGNYCGLAWLFNNYWLDQLGFSVVDEECATGYYSFGHELGHNMGLDHDTYVANNTMFPYGHGFAYPAGKWRTIMAYSNACSAQGVSCPKIQYFSTPFKARNGVAIGDASTADNHRVLNETAYEVANFRQSNAVDTTPNTFTFTDQTNVALFTEIVSDSITVSGINAAANINIIGGEYSINGGAYTSVDGTVTNGNTVTVKHTSSDQHGTATNTILTIGGVSDTFTSTTASQSHTLNVNKSGTGTGTVTSSPAGINCGNDCEQTYASGGQTITLTAAASTGSIFTGWSGDCTVVTTNPKTCKTTISGAKTLTANFDLIVYKLTVNKDGNGTISSVPTGIDCGSDCTEDYLPRTSVTLTATPDTGHKFIKWTGGCSGTVITCTVTMSAAKTVNATFTPVFPLTVSKTGIGTGKVTATGINCDTSATPDCTETYLKDARVTLTAAATPGSRFTGWSGACTGTTCSVTMNEAKNVTANFDFITFNLTVAKVGNGSITSNPAGIDCGADCDEAFRSMTPATPVTLTATPDAGYKFIGWTGGCRGTATTCTVSMNAAKSVTATFQPIFTLTVNKSGTGTGTVTSKPSGINCGTDCTEDYLGGTSVTLTAKAATGSRFTGWSGACTGTSTCRVTMTTANAAVANFVTP
jgi:uncharacterized repeat protein (TIGR02543 family)